MKYYSQVRQDEFLDKVIFKKKQNGFFIDVGAYDDITFSNSYFFETKRQWDGICIEPIKKSYDNLKKCRNCKAYNIGVAEKETTKEFMWVDGPSEMLSGVTEQYDEKHLDRIEKEIEERGGTTKHIEIKCRPICSIIEQEKAYKIDYMSIDVEGSEIEVLKSINWSETEITALSVENNYNDQKIRRYLKSNSFRFLGKLDTDDIYVSDNLKVNWLTKLTLFIYNMQFRIKRKVRG